MMFSVLDTQQGGRTDNVRGQSQTINHELIAMQVRDLSAEVAAEQRSQKFGAEKAVAEARAQSKKAKKQRQKAKKQQSSQAQQPQDSAGNRAETETESQQTQHEQQAQDKQQAWHEQQIQLEQQAKHTQHEQQAKCEKQTQHEQQAKREQQTQPEQQAKHTQKEQQIQNEQHTLAHRSNPATRHQQQQRKPIGLSGYVQLKYTDNANEPISPAVSDDSEGMCSCLHCSAAADTPQALSELFKEAMLGTSKVLMCPLTQVGAVNLCCA